MSNIKENIGVEIRRTVVLLIALLLGAVVFMGIEGSHEELTTWKTLEEQEKLNLTLAKVKCLNLLR